MSDLRSRLQRRTGPTPRGYRPSEYKRWFPATARVFLRYLKHHRALPVRNPHEGPTVGVVVAPWVSTAGPWYAIMLAIGLARRQRRVALIWDDTAFPERFVDLQNQAIAQVLEYVGRFLPVTRLSDQARDAGGGEDAHAIDKLTDQVVAWCLKGAPVTDGDQPLVKAIRASLADSLPLVRSALGRATFEYVVVPGGIYGTSGLFRLAAAEHGIRVATFDADRGVAQLCVNGVAAQNADLPQAFDALWSSDEDTRRQAIDVARAEFQQPRPRAATATASRAVREQTSTPGRSRRSPACP